AAFVSTSPQAIGDTLLKQHPNPTDPRLRFLVRPASASDAASWYMASAELFRDVAVSASRLLQGAGWGDCRDRPITGSISTLAGDTIHVTEYLAASLAEAVEQMISSAESASRHVRYSVASQGSGVDGSWRGAYDSRLTAASLFVNMLPTHRGQAVPSFVRLYEAKYTTSGEERRYFTTSPDDIADEYKTELNEVGWVFDPSAPQPPRTTPIFTHYLDGVPWYSHETDLRPWTSDISLQGYAPDVIPLGGSSIILGSTIAVGVFGDNTWDGKGTWPTAERGATPEVAYAADLIRTSGVDPATPEADLANAVYENLNAMYGGAFGLDRDAALAALQVGEQSLEDARNLLVQRARALGHSIWPHPVEDGLRYRYPQPNQRPNDIAYLFARTEGRAPYFDHTYGRSASPFGTV
ncbi:MAG: hypothetical protein MO852_16655, partial [Candidatus Devosia euplotis]|nr:hypothetical protein [Candidatus Devosia euplotis]